MRKCRPFTLKELKAMMEAFAEGVDQEEVKSLFAEEVSQEHLEAAASNSFAVSRTSRRVLSSKISKCPIKSLLEMSWKISFSAIKI